MAGYTISYLDGDSQTVTADYLEPSQGQYVAFADGAAVAYIPIQNVRSVVREQVQPGGDSAQARSMGELR